MDGWGAWDDDDWDPYEQAEEYEYVLTDFGSELSVRINQISQAMTDFDSDAAISGVAAFCAVARRGSPTMVAAFLGLTALHRRCPELGMGDADELSDCPAEPLSAVDPARWPDVPRTGVRKGVRVLVARTAECTDELDGWAEYIEAILTVATEAYGSDKPAELVGLLAAMVTRVVDRVAAVVELWQKGVIDDHRKLARTQKGLHPPVLTDRRTALEQALDAIDAAFGEGRPA